jgi:hypothetical protein
VARSHVVVVLGYAGEPAIRLAAHGVAANEASLTAAGMGLVNRNIKRTGGEPSWRRISSATSVVWHDARLHGLLPGVTRRRWTVPLVVDGSRTSIGGELVRVAAPSPWPWAALGLAAATAAAIVIGLRRGQLLRTATVWLGVVAAAATLATAVGFALASSAAEGAWVEGANELVFALVGLAFVLRGSPDTRALAAGALGMLALAAGLYRFPVFLHGIVLSAFPAGLTRASVALSISAGTAAFATGLMVFFDVLEHYEEPVDFDEARF